MRKIRWTRQHIRLTALAMAAVVGFLPPFAAFAAEEDAAQESSAEENMDMEEDTESDSEETETDAAYPKSDEDADENDEPAEDETEAAEEEGEGMIPDLKHAREALQEIAEAKSILASVYLCEEYEVKEEPSAEADTVYTVGSGQSVQIMDAGLDETGNVWYWTLFYRNGEEYKGYIERNYLAASDEEFKQWEEDYLVIPETPAPKRVKARKAAVSYPDVEQFPASYQNALYQLKADHPNWTFVRMDTGVDWNTAISKELGDKSLVPSTSSGSWQTGVYGQGWSYASEGILKYYMDPRNFLTDPSVFQFEQLTYNDSYHTTEAVQEIVKSSFMSSTIPGDSQTYAQAFHAIGKSTGVSPFHLASRVLQEQGTKGTSPLISGSYPGYEGYYNYFNVGASGKTSALVVESGLKKAKENGWNTRYKSLSGGAYVIGVNYILKGQDTLYLEKFNVSGGYHANFTHQYMQNIQAPNSEASGIRKAYNNAGALENSFVFKIPVYQNMPASACSKPGVTDTITLDQSTISGLEVGETVRLTPYVNGSKVDYISNMTFSSDDPSVASVDSSGKVTAAAPGNVVISCRGSSGSTAVCNVTVVKATPEVSTPTLSPCTYKEGLRLADITLPEGWSWVKADTGLKAGTYSYEALYTPADPTKYNTVTKNISFTVTKAVPVCTMPEEPRVSAGTRLGDIKLPSGFTWESDTETELQEPGEYTFYVSYNPDENNYHSAGHLPFVVTVLGEDGGSSDEDDIPVVGGNGSGTGTNGGTESGSGGSETGGSGTGTESGNSGSGTGTGSGTESGNGGSEAGGSSGSGTGMGGGTGSGSDTGTENGNSGTGGGSNSGSGTGTGGGTESGNGGSGIGGGSGSDTGTESGNSGTGGGSNSGSGTGTGGGIESGNGGSEAGGSSGSGTGTGSGTQSGSGSGTVTGSGSGTGAPLKELPTSSGSGQSTKKESESKHSEKKESGGSQSGQPSQKGADSSQQTQSAAPQGQSAQSGGGDNRQPQSITDSNQPAQNGTGDNQQIQKTTESNQPAQSKTGSSRQSQSAASQKRSAQSTTDGNRQSTAENSQPVQAASGENQDVQTEAEEKSFRPAVTMDMTDTTVLTPENLQLAKEQNLDLLLKMGKYAAWSIDIDSVDMDTVAEVDMGIMLGTENVPADIIAAILNGNKYLEFTLSHDGTFGFLPTLRIAFDPANAGRYANLFYYNEEENALEFICDAVIDEDGVAAFMMEHASCYIIIVSDTSMAGMTAAPADESPGLPWIIIGIIVCVLAAGGGCGFFFWRKKMQEEEDEEADDEEEEEYEDEEEEGYEEEENAGDQGDEDEVDDHAEDDWIEDQDWQETEAAAETSEKTETEASSDRFVDDHAEDDWIEDDEWDIGNDWIEDEEWEKRKEA